MVKYILIFLDLYCTQSNLWHVKNSKLKERLNAKDVRGVSHPDLSSRFDAWIKFWRLAPSFANWSANELALLLTWQRGSRFFFIANIVVIISCLMLLFSMSITILVASVLAPCSTWILGARFVWFFHFHVFISYDLHHSAITFSWQCYCLHYHSCLCHLL